MAIRCIKSRYSCKNKIEDNQHRGQVKKMEVGRTYPTNGQEQQMWDGVDLDPERRKKFGGPKTTWRSTVENERRIYWGGTAGTRPDV